MKFPKENKLDKWLEENKDPEIDRYIERNLEITQRVCATLNEKGINKKEFASMLNKKPSEVSKLLSGTHNLTLKSITKMEIALNVDLMNPEPQYIYLGKIDGTHEGFRSATKDYELSHYTKDAV